MVGVFKQKIKLVSKEIYAKIKKTYSSIGSGLQRKNEEPLC